MSDRFRYRLWDGEKKAYAHEGYVVSQLGVVGTYDPFVGLIRNINCTVEHCTGLTDKNGKLIYEGDVLLFNGSRNPVYFDDGSFVILHDGSVLVPIKQKITDVFEIIGNIHEMEVQNASKM